MQFTCFDAADVILYEVDLNLSDNFLCFQVKARLSQCLRHRRVQSTFDIDFFFDDHLKSRSASPFHSRLTTGSYDFFNKIRELIKMILRHIKSIRFNAPFTWRRVESEEAIDILLLKIYSTSLDLLRKFDVEL